MNDMNLVTTSSHCYNNMLVTLTLLDGCKGRGNVRPTAEKNHHNKEAHQPSP